MLNLKYPHNPNINKKKEKKIEEVRKKEATKIL